MNPYAPTSPHYATAQRILEAGYWLTWRDLGVSPDVATRVRARLRRAGLVGRKAAHCERCGRIAKAALCWRCQGGR